MTQKMTSLEHRDAANALIGWFNSQQVGPEDAGHIMRKVWAKLLIDQTTDLKLLGPIIHDHMSQLVDEMARRIPTNGRR